MAEHDLSQRMIPYLDRHLAFPLLAHLEKETSLYPINEVQIAQYELAKGTNMFDYAASLFSIIKPDEEVPQEFETKRQEAVSTNERLQQEAQAVLDVIENPDVAQNLRQDKNQNLQYLKEHYNLEPVQLTALYNFGKFQYSYGNYSGAADFLYHFRVLSTDPELTLSAHWGKLASDILSGKWDAGLEELNSLRELIDSRAAAPVSAAAPSNNGAVEPAALTQLHARTWLLHWSLFIYFNHPEGRTLLLDTFLSPTYLNTIQTSSPWILRYLSVAAILSRRPTPTPAPVASIDPNNPAATAVPAAPSATANINPTRVKTALRELVKVLSTESYHYSDPITQFLLALYVDFDFDAAQSALATAESVVGDDFFLGEFREEFLDAARWLVSEAYTRVFGKIDVGDLSKRLNLSPAEGEKWIVNLIRETRMGNEAKIDLEKNVIEINRPPMPVYQTVIEKTRGLALRTQAMGAAMVRPQQQQQPAASKGVEVGA